MSLIQKCDHHWHLLRNEDHQEWNEKDACGRERYPRTSRYTSVNECCNCKKIKKETAYSWSEDFNVGCGIEHEYGILHRSTSKPPHLGWRTS